MLEGMLMWFFGYALPCVGGTYFNRIVFKGHPVRGYIAMHIALLASLLCILVAACL